MYNVDYYYVPHNQLDEEMLPKKRTSYHDPLNDWM